MLVASLTYFCTTLLLLPRYCLAIILLNAMSSTQTDIILLGATGFTGRLITRYLAAHPQFKQGLFSFSIAARSQSKLHTLVQQLSLPPTINTVQVDVTDYADLEKLVRSTKIVINAVGPYWRWGSPVVRCVAKILPHFIIFITLSQGMCEKWYSSS
jgi:short subunit dehydrogenase-like uncharacterized protein